VNCYPFIEAEKSQRRNVKRACELLKVSRSAYFAARPARPSDRAGQDAELAAQSRRCTRYRRGVTAPRGSTRSCAPRAGGTPASGSPG
jgi:hypothetical protein